MRPRKTTASTAGRSSAGQARGLGRRPRAPQVRGPEAWHEAGDGDRAHRRSEVREAKGDDREHRRSESRRPDERPRKTTASTAGQSSEGRARGWENDREHRRSEFRGPARGQGRRPRAPQVRGPEARGRRPRAPQVRGPEAEGDDREHRRSELPRPGMKEYDREHRRSEFQWAAAASPPSREPRESDRKPRA